MKPTNDFSIPKTHEPDGDPCRWCGKPVAEHTEPIEVFYEIYSSSGGHGSGTLKTTWAALRGGVAVTVEDKEKRGGDR